MPKLYSHSFDIDGEDALAKIAKQVCKQIDNQHQDATNCFQILDLGCGSADLGAFLRSNKSATVIGVENHVPSLAIAEQKLNKAVQIDLNSELLSNKLGEYNSQFDVIILADILEHLYQPDFLLTQLATYLKENGRLFISIPNAAYAGALLYLYNDEWNYQAEGILDSTHVRFFTKKSIIQLLDNNRFVAKIVDRVHKEPFETEFYHRIDCLPDTIRNWLLAKPEGAAYQLIIEATPKCLTDKQTVAQNDVELIATTSFSLLHSVFLYFQEHCEQDFSADKFVASRQPMGQQNQHIFNIPAAQLSKLRLNFADRRSVYYIDSIEIYSNNELLLDLTKNPIKCYECQTLDNTLPSRFLANNEHSHLVWELPEILLTKNDLQNPETANFTVKINMSAPISEQNLAFVDNAATNFADNKSEYHQQQQTIQQLNQQLNTITNSTSWKITQPLRLLKSKINRYINITRP